MTPFTQEPLVSTIGERCRVCYQCVRECPAKAIRIADRQAEVMPERCIGCGDCVQVCTQDAKRILSAVEAVETLLAGPAPVAAIVAPSFPAEFIALRLHAGRGHAAGAWASPRCTRWPSAPTWWRNQYQRLVAEDTDKRWIATTCPAVVGYVERYHPDLTGSLAPVVSPMIAMARLLRAVHGDAIRVVFIGPCIAKKREAISPDLDGEVDEALTFTELRQMLAARGIDLDAVTPGDFDPPHARGGGLFPISGGMLQVAGIQEDLVTGHVMVGEGPAEFAQAIKEAETGIMETRLLELLFCNGCTMGPGMSRTCRSSAGGRASASSCGAASRASTRRSGPVVTSTGPTSTSRAAYSPNDQRMPVPSPEELTAPARRLGKSDPRRRAELRRLRLRTCREHAIAIYDGLAESEMCLPHTIEQLRSTVRELAHSNERARQHPGGAGASPRSWRAWASWPPASPTR